MLNWVWQMLKFLRIAELESFLLLLVYWLFFCCVSRHKQRVIAAWLYYDGFDAMIASVSCG